MQNHFWPIFNAGTCCEEHEMEVVPVFPGTLLRGPTSSCKLWSFCRPILLLYVFQREEEARKDEEKRRAAEERRRLERERILKERRDADERDRKMNEKLQMIEEQRWEQCSFLIVVPSSG